MTDRSLGGSSINDGSMELMVELTLIFGSRFIVVKLIYVNYSCIVACYMMTNVESESL